MNVTVRGRTRHYRTVTFDPARNAVLLIEQRLLPHEFKIVATKNFRETAGAIHDMIVRGAGAIGATAAYGLAQGALAFRGRDLRKFRRHVETVYQTLKAARPTAVDPVNAMNGVRAAMRAGETVAEQQSLALAAAEEFANEDVRALRSHRPARREADSQRHENSHALQRRLAGVRGRRHRHRADVCRAGAGQKIPRLLRRNPSAFAGRNASPRGNWRSKKFPTRSSPTTPPAI